MSDPELNQSSSEEATLASRGYKLIKKLGEGSYAKVYLTNYNVDKQSTQKNWLACKVVDTSKAPKDFVRKFLPRELDILVKLNHPHIVHVHSIFQRRSKYFIFMRYAENGDLLDFVLKNGAVAESQARVWLRQLALAVQYLHELEIAHRDLKCENVLITANFNVKLADFGFARFVTDNKGKRVLSDTYCGSLSYAAPEILKGSPYNPKLSDIWSLGVILYIMLNKAMPFDDTNIKRLYEQQSNRRWKFRAKVVDVLSEQVKKLVINILEPDITRRWRMDQVLNSDWVAMDPRLLVLTSAEQQAVQHAVDERRVYAATINAPEVKKPITTGSSISKNRQSIGHAFEDPKKKKEDPIPVVEQAAQAVAAGIETVTVIKEVHTNVQLAESQNIDNKMADFILGNVDIGPTLVEE